MPQDPSDANSQFHSIAGVSPQVSSRLALKFNPEAYRQVVADAELNREQEDALLEALWQIVVSFVDMGFGLHPMQQMIADAKTLDVDSPSVVDCANISETNEKKDAERSDVRAVQRMDS